MLHLGVVSRMEAGMMAEGASSSLSGGQPLVPVGALLNHLPKFNGLNILYWKTGRTWNKY